MDLSIIIINWKSKDYLRKCLASIYTEKPGFPFEVIIVDNASFDGADEMLKAEFPAAHYIQSQENLGFSRGNALGAAKASGNIFLFLNPDTEMHPEALKLLYEATTTLPNVGAVGARLLNSDGSLQMSCLQAFPTIINQMLDANFLRRIFPRAKLWGTAPLHSSAQTPSPVEGISGACLMTPRAAFQEVGGFSENYFMYYEDMDYCLKVKKTGRQNYYIPQAEVIHHGGKSSASAVSKFSSVMMAESGWRFFNKQHGCIRAGMFRWCIAAKALSRSLLLAAMYPFAWRPARRLRVKNAFRKWMWVARWAFGIEHWVADY